MRQVPRYLIIGNGKVARHMCHYFSLLGLSFTSWSRNNNSQEELAEKLSLFTHILFLITDGAIEPFINSLKLEKNQQKKLIHFSGCLQTPLAISVHPLQTFAQNLYTLTDYQKIPFIVEDQPLSFYELLPGLSNPHYYISPKDKAYYHAQCVMANNFTTILWQRFYKIMQSKFNIPQEDLLPFFQRTTKNLEKNVSHALTGPFVRNDQDTINKNLTALLDDPFYAIYQAFAKVSYEEFKNE